MLSHIVLLGSFCGDTIREELSECITFLTKYEGRYPKAIELDEEDYERFLDEMEEQDGIEAVEMIEELQETGGEFEVHNIPTKRGEITKFYFDEVSI